MKILAIIVFVYVVGGFLGSTYELHDTEATWVGTGTGGYEASASPQTTLEYLLNMRNAIQMSSDLGPLSIPMPNDEYFNSAYRVITLQFSFLADYDMFSWIFLTPFALLGIIALIVLVYGILTGNLTWS
jgi:hypothetical protein